jgi:hypothetical protein
VKWRIVKCSLALSKRPVSPIFNPKEDIVTLIHVTVREKSVCMQIM